MFPGMKTSAPRSCWRLSRAGGIDPNPTTYAQRAGQFASAAMQCGQVTLLLTSADGQMTGWMLAPEHPSASDAAMQLAATVAARVDRADPPDLSGTREQATMAALSGAPPYRETLNGQDPAEFSRQMALAMRDGEWVAVTVRAPSRREGRTHKAWVSDRLGGSALPTHHSLAPGALVVTVRAGSPQGHGRTGALLAAAAAAMPGFDVATRAKRVPTRAWVVLAVAALAIAAWGLPRVAGVVPALHEFLAGATWWQNAPNVGWVLGLLLGGYAAAAGWGLVRAPGDRARAALGSMRFASAPRRWWPARKARDVRQEDGTYRHREAQYPLAAAGFLVGPQVIVGLVAPHAGAASGQNATADRATPAILSEPIGPLVGQGADGRPVHISAADMLFGVGAVGRAGSGKSQLVRFLFAWTLAERLHPSCREGFPGQHSSLIAFESKGEGAQVYTEWGRSLGHEPVVMEIADPASPAVDLFDVPGTVRERAEFFANAMVYAFEPGSIQDRSFSTLVQVFTAALAITPALADQVEGVNPHGSPVYFAHLLLGGEGDRLASALAGALTSEAVRQEGAGTPVESLTLARKALAPLYEGKSEAARRPFLEAPVNKVSQLLAAGSWWSPARPRMGWAKLLEDGYVVVVNTGVTRAGTQVEDRLMHQMSALLMFGLRHAIARTCSGWNAAGRSVCLFADELSLLAGASPEVVTWLRNQGRSYGVRPVLATQYPDQLNPDVRAALLSFSTLLTFAQDAGRTATDAAADMAADGSQWDQADVVNLPRFTAIMRTNVDQARVPACTVKVANFEADQAGFVAAQGEALRAAVAPPAVDGRWGW